MGELAMLPVRTRTCLLPLVAELRLKHSLGISLELEGRRLLLLIVSVAAAVLVFFKWHVNLLLLPRPPPPPLAYKPIS